MRITRSTFARRRLNLQAVSLLIALAGAGAAQTPPLNKQPQGFDDFTLRVQQYMKLRKELPNQRTTKRQEQIVSRRRSLAAAIREARPQLNKATSLHRRAHRNSSR